MLQVGSRAADSVGRMSEVFLPLVGQENRPADGSPDRRQSETRSVVDMVETHWTGELGSNGVCAAGSGSGEHRALPGLLLPPVQAAPPSEATTGQAHGAVGPAQVSLLPVLLRPDVCRHPTVTLDGNVGFSHVFHIP